jgi:hypothetical protein
VDNRHEASPAARVEAVTTERRPTIDVHAPFTRAAALAAGFDPTHAPTRYLRLFQGVYVDAGARIDDATRARAALALFGPGAFASHVSAARVCGVPVPTIPEEHVTVRRPGDRRRPVGVVPHLHPDPDVRVVSGVPVSAPAQMFVELAGLIGLVDLVVVGDHLVRRRWITLEELRTACAASRVRGARAARRAAAYVRKGVDSPMETRLRMLLVLAGLPEPEVNLTIRDDLGEPICRYDLSWPGIRVAVEYDGRQHIEREAAWEDDLDRREDLDDARWRILVVTSRGIYREPHRTVERVWRLLRARRLPGTPVRPRDDWRPHFPVR